MYGPLTRPSADGHPLPQGGAGRNNSGAGGWMGFSDGPLYALRGHGQGAQALAGGGEDRVADGWCDAHDGGFSGPC